MSTVISRLRPPSASPSGDSSTALATSGETYRPKALRMISRWRSPSTIALKARVRWPTSSRELTVGACERSPAATRPAAPVSATIGRVSRRAKTMASTTDSSTPATLPRAIVLSSSRRRSK